MVGSSYENGEGPDLYGALPNSGFAFVRLVLFAAGAGQCPRTTSDDEQTGSGKEPAQRDA